MRTISLLCGVAWLATIATHGVYANIGRGIPVHHELTPRVGQSTDQIKAQHVVRRKTPSSPQNQYRRRQLLEAGIEKNVRQAVDLQRRQGGFGTSTQPDNPAAAAAHGSTEQQSAQLNDPTTECTPYYLPIISTIKSQFPTVWQVADILQGDTQALQIMQQINASGLIPSSIGVRGTTPNSYYGAGLAGTYDIAGDPDCWWTDHQCITPKHAGLLPDIATCNEPFTWGYTFDDGPNCTHNALYDMWAQNNQKASLMYIGSNVLDWPLEAQRGIVDGHHICVHTWSHKYMTSLTTNEAFAELWYTIKAIKYVMGVTPTCWRPPYGDVDDRIRGIAQGLGLRTIMWNTDTNDWNVQPWGPIPTASLRQTYSSIIAQATQPAAATGGIIVLEHELEQSAMNMSMEQYPAVKAAWKNVVPLTACLNITNPYPEAITYPDFEEYTSGNVVAVGLPQSSLAISSTASVIPQGTLSGMGGVVATASDGSGNSKQTIQATASASGGSGVRASSHSSGATTHQPSVVLALLVVIAAISTGVLSVFM